MQRKLVELKEAASKKMTKSFSSCASVASFYSVVSDDEFFDLQDVEFVQFHCSSINSF